MVNAISVDVEEYFHATNLRHVAPPAKWPSLPSRCDYNTRRALDLFAEAGVRGTFFMLGCVARRKPALVQDIAAAGHEIGSHGYAHELAYEMSPKRFYHDVRRTKLLLEDISGSPVRGYRAPSFSITSKNLWAYEELLRAGYSYDSSLYPIRHSRYGNVERKREPEALKLNGSVFKVLPLAVCRFNLLGQNLLLPVAGGGLLAASAPVPDISGVETDQRARPHAVCLLFSPLGTGS